MSMFRNLRLYRVHSDWPATESALARRLESLPFTPCGSLAERSAGWEPPADPYPALAREVGRAMHFQLREQSRVLPAAAVAEALAERVASFEARTSRKPGRKEARELKEETFMQLLPRALVKSDRIQCCWLERERVLGVATASAPQAERVLDALRTTFGALDVTPLEFVKPLATWLASLYLGKPASRAFSIGRECRMVDPAGSRASVVWTDMDVTDGAVQRHVRDGLKIDRLALSYGEVMSFVLDGEATLRKIRVSGDEGDDTDDAEEPLARQDARFVLFTGTLERLLGDLGKALGGYA